MIPSTQNEVVMKPEFDEFAESYDKLIKNPVRDLFSSHESMYFHTRKRDLILDRFRKRGISLTDSAYLDIGCGKGELLGLLRNSVGSVAGCDPSAKMLAQVDGVDVRVQEDPRRIPFEDQSADLVTAVCVYHHVPVEERVALTREVVRVLRPGGTFCIIEHNPINPMTRWIVGRTPVDAEAVLLPLTEARTLLQQAGVEVQDRSYFLYLPEALYRVFGWVEGMLTGIPLGGQYAIYGRRPT
ncbi:MAG: class I SAM-dependent methyltransferase [Bryobacteraceae bacterium]